MYGNYLFQSWLPTILSSHLGYGLSASGLLADIPYFLSPFVLFFSGVCVDAGRCVERNETPAS